MVLVPVGDHSFLCLGVGRVTNSFVVGLHTNTFGSSIENNWMFVWWHWNPLLPTIAIASSGKNFKVPWPYWLSAVFLQQFLDVIRESIVVICLNFLNMRENVAIWNDNLITLIPKVMNATHIKEFRSISLCNVLYKIVVKALTNQIRSFMSSIVDENQSAFIAGCHIGDNIMIW